MQDRVLITDFENLQGKWRQVRFEENGLIDPPDTHGAEGAVLTISGTGFHVAVPGGETLIEGNFVLHDLQSPKGIDWIDSMGEDAGKILPAVYRISPDSFEFAAADSGMARPVDFDGGRGITIRAFVRV